VLFRGVLVYGNTGLAGVSSGDLLGLPDEVLEKVALVLGE